MEWSYSGVIDVSRGELPRSLLSSGCDHLKIVIFLLLCLPAFLL
jgi:hypothetical protein